MMEYMSEICLQRIVGLQKRDTFDTHVGDRRVLCASLRLGLYNRSNVICP